MYELQTYKGVIGNDTEESEEELACRFKIHIKNLANFDSRTRKSQKFTLEWAAFDPVI